jgi:Protein of unknown function (DUF3433)
VELRLPGPFIQVDYFNGLFLCLVVNVLFKSAWSIVFASTKMMEPFYQLSKEGGASAKESLFSDYLSDGISLRSLQNIFSNHYVMNLTAFIYIFLTVTCSVASEAMTIRAGDCQTKLGPQVCEPMWVVQVRVVRGLESFLAFAAAMIIVRIILSYKRPRGVFSYPCSIASMAALFSNQDAIDDFRQIDPQADNDALAKALAGNQYTLERYEMPSGIVRYGLTKAVVQPGTRPQRSLSSDFSEVSNPAAKSANHRNWVPWASILTILFLGLHGAFFAVILDYQLNHADTSLFLNKATFGPRFVMVCVALLIDTGWKRLEREVRIMIPYRRLAKQDASSRDLVVMPLHGVPITTFPRAIWLGNFYHAFVAFVAILSDFLIIAVSAIPYNFGQLHNVSLVSSLTSLVILGVMMIAIITVFVWRLGNPKMPRQPDTLANVWMLLCGSRMLEDFEGMEEVSKKARDFAIRRSGRRYWFGKANGIDGKERDMVDEAHSDSEES